MEIINRIPRMVSLARELRSQGTRVGLVPVRRSLHEAHLSLAGRAREMCDSVVVSLYSDPPANSTEDSRSDLARDAELAFTRGVDFIFAPASEDMFGADHATFVTVDGLVDKLEGAGRPGYLRGTATAINKLLNITQPRFVFLGRKEVETAIIVRRMIQELAMDVEAVICPMVREEDGLALSPSNADLSTEERRSAVVLHRALDRCRSLSNAGEKDAAKLIASMRSLIEAEPLARIDHIDIVDTDRLGPVDWVSTGTPALVSLAVFIGQTRLTDNIVLNGEL